MRAVVARVKLQRSPCAGAQLAYAYCGFGVYQAV
ncbi:Hypothetical Protein XCAW_00484 [Xanthomonas citri subsp. citri Aw12879]|nr:Hypothetical Protein XCAW_00484 [Xanthomonas citri subsp. citri Aw12879]